MMKLKRLNAQGFSHDVVAVLFVAVFAISGVGYLVASNADPITGSSFIDVSSPQCGQLNVISHHQQGIVGVNSNKGAFLANSCLRQEVNLFSNFALYTVGNWPSPHCANVLHITSPYACGKASAAWAMGYAGSQHVSAKGWWIDVETGAGWSSNTSQNVQYLQGMFDQLATKVPKVGFYSTQHQWKVVTGDWKNDSPTWYASGLTAKSTPASIRSYCSLKFTHSSNLFVQYINTKNANIDVNVPC